MQERPSTGAIVDPGLPGTSLPIQDRYIWSNETTSALLSLYEKAHIRLLQKKGNGINGRGIYKKIVKSMKRMGHGVSTGSCKSKIKSLNIQV